jgi:hypothetical protein
MTNTGNSIRESLQKRQEAIIKHVTRKRAFLTLNEQMKRDIEEARLIWIKTLEQLPKSEF